jgi:WD40 repeat protein
VITSSVALIAALACGATVAEARTPGTTALLSPDAQHIVAQRGPKLAMWGLAGARLGSSSNKAPLRGALAGGALVGVFEARTGTGQRLLVLRGKGYRKRVSLRLPKTILTVLRTAISPDGRVAAAFYAADGGAGDATAASFFDARSGRRLGRARLAKGKGRWFGASFSRDGRRVALYGDIGRQSALVEVYALAQGKRCPRRRGRRGPGCVSKLSRWKHAADKTVFSAALSPDGSRVAVGAGRRLVILDAKTGRSLRSRPTRATLALFPARLRRLVPRFPGAHQLVFSHDGKSLAVLHAFGVTGVARWDVARLAPSRWLPRPASQGLPRQLAFSPAGSLWLVTAGRGAAVELFEATGRGFLRRRGLSF